ncbi:MAG: hypothetical protein AAF755_04205 [Pseudomonadota bacterium]
MKPAMSSSDWALHLAQWLFADLPEEMEQRAFALCRRDCRLATGTQFPYSGAV